MRREIPRFSRVIIETTGLAEPRHVIDILGADPFIDGRFTWAAIVATVDGITGAASLDQFSEAVAQAACADRLVVTKTDVAPRNEVKALMQRLRILNPQSDIIRSPGASSLVALMEPRRSADALRDLARRNDGPIHSAATSSVWLRLAAPVSRPSFAAAFEALLGRFDSKILRAKGLIAFAGENALSVVQYVRGGALEVGEAEFVPDEHRRPGLVVFATCVDPDGIADCLAAARLEAMMPHGHAHPRGVN